MCAHSYREGGWVRENFKKERKWWIRNDISIHYEVLKSSNHSLSAMEKESIGDLRKERENTHLVQSVEKRLYQNTWQLSLEVKELNDNSKCRKCDL